MSSNIRWPKVNEAIQTVKSASPDKDSNQRYSEAMVSIDNNQLLTILEKEAAKKYFTREKDRENLLFIKGPKYLCETCNRDGYTLGYCEHCLRDCLKSQFANWTSGNDIIDKAIQNSQIKLPLPLQIIEWIPFEDLKDINYHTDGGYSAIYTATWTKGYIKSFDKETQKFERSTPWKCILKTLLESNSAKEKFLQEIELHISLRANAYKLVGCRGVSRDPTTGDYILVLDPMLHDLRHFTHTDNINTTWNTLCLNIVTALAQIHQEGLVHKDLHSGNILQRPDSVWVIADLGFCGPPNTLSGQLYGCIPYVAPELLFSLSSSVPLPYTSASDIYSVGMLIYEVVTGQPPFRNIYKDPKELAIDVCSGIRPEIPAGVPEHLVVLMRRCWKADPSERPTAAELCTYFSKLSKSLANENIVIKRSNASLLDIQDFTNKSKSYQFEGLPKPKDITQDEKSKSFHLVPSHIKEKSSETKKTSLFDNKSFSEEKNGANITDSIMNYNLKAPIHLPLKTTSNYSKLLGPNIVTNFWKKLLLRYCCINPG